jgi:hypothetical protein
VGAHVLGQVAAGSKALAALGAQKRLRPRVGAHVPGQVATLSKALAALGARKRLGPRVGAHVRGQLAVGRESFVALSTREGRVITRNAFTALPRKPAHCRGQSPVAVTPTREAYTPTLCR